MTAQAVNRPVIALNGKIGAEEATRILGCAYSHTINLLKKKKLKGQKLEGKWFVEADDVYKAKNSNLVTPRPRKEGKKVLEVKHESPVSSISNTVKVQIEMDRAKFDVLRMVFQEKNKSIVQFLTDQLNGTYEKVIEKLKDVSV